MTPVADARPAHDRLGAVTGPREVTFVRELPGPIERVWSFLVDSEKRARWFAGGELEPRTGGHIALIFNNGQLAPPNETVSARHAKHSGEIHSEGTVTVFDPPSRLAFEWGGPGGPSSQVSFELEEIEGEKVRLTLVHSKLSGRSQMTDVSGGWHAHLGVLRDALEGRAPQAFWAKLDEVEPIYEETLPRD